MEVGSDTHLALSYDAVGRLENPGGVLHDLKERAGELGVITDSAEPYVVNDLGRRHDVHIDFYSVPPGTLNGLERAKKDDHPPETRYVYVGVGKRDEVAAEKAGWDYIDFGDAAADEGWEVENKR